MFAWFACALPLRLTSSTSWTALLAASVASAAIVGNNESLAGASGSGFPRKPIKVIVYTNPGGPIDLTARRFVEVAVEYTDATFVVQNKPGAGGIIAFQQVLQSRADGHTLCACTKSNIAKIVSAGKPGYLEAMNWLALMLIDRECVITRRNDPLQDWNALVADMRQKNGKQVWVGPASGGLDHVVAMQIWDRLDAKATWIPHKGGSDALAALLRDEGVAYVGNPADVIGLPDLTVAAVSSSDRLEQFPQAPTFSELGIQGLDDLYMWRGFALKQGCSPTVVNWYHKLIADVTNDPRWRSFWEKDGIQVVHKGPTEFQAIVDSDRQQFRHYLRQLDLLPESTDSEPLPWPWVLIVSLTGLAIVGLVIWRSGHWQTYGSALVPLGLSLFAAVLWIQTLRFPTSQGVGPAVVPRLWMVAIFVLSALAVFQPQRESDARGQTQSGKSVRVAGIGLTLVGYVLATVYLGYFVSTFCFLTVAMLLLGERRVWLILAVNAAWLCFAYVTFVRVLYVPLPQGFWWEYV